MNLPTLQITDKRLFDPNAIPGMARVVKRYPQFLPLTELSQEHSDTSHHLLLADLQHHLRKAWDAPDLRAREWYTFLARRHHYDRTVIWPKREARMVYREGDALYVAKDPEMWTPAELAMLEEPPPLTPFEQALFHFHRIAERARHCGNPECPAPYFIAKRNSQKYCSQKCAAPIAQLQKNRWWRENRGVK